LKVFYFAKPWTWKRWREKYAKELKKRFGKKKTDYGDAYILSRIHDGKPRFFKEVKPLDVEFKPLLMKEKKLADVLLGLRQMQMLGVNAEDLIGVMEGMLTKLRRDIVERAVEKIPRFMEIAEKLGLNNDDVNALLALAGLLIYLKWPYEVASMHKAIRFLGLYKPTRKDVEKFEERAGEDYVKRYSGGARRCLNSLTTAILNREKGVFPPRARDERKVLKRLLKILESYNGGAANGGAG